MTNRVRQLLCLIMLCGLLLPAFAGCAFFTTAPGAPSDDPTNDPTQDPDDPDSPSIDTDLIPDDAKATVVINELCADNKGSYKVGVQKPDWIELYNTSDTEAVDLSGWKLADNDKGRDAYTFPKGTKIEPNKLLVLVAVGAEEISKWQGLHEAVPFRLSESGESVYLFDNTGKLHNAIDYPAIHMKDVEVTYARVNDGLAEWGEANPTPGRSNKNSTRLLSADIMTFSHESGFYDEAFDLTITVPRGYNIYYTTDCSDPRTSSTAKKWTSKTELEVYDKSPYADTFSIIKVTDDYMYNPLGPVDKCFVVRAIITDSNQNRSRTVTKTYFIGFDEKDGYTNIPIVTLTADPVALYYGDENTTPLFVAPSWGHNSSVNRHEIEADMTYIDADGNYVFGQKVGMRIRGTSTRGAHQKNLNIFARSKYDGNASFIDPLFDGVTTTKSFVLRNDGMDRLTIGQGFLQDLVADREISTQKYYPVAVFLDGEYYGIYNLYERFSADYVEEHYNVDSSDVWICKKGGSSSMMEANCTEAANDYTSLMHFICNVNQSNDLSNPATYQKLTERVDIQSLCDILAVQLYIGNEDFAMSQNITAWRSATVDPSNPYADGKWRFVIYDLDFTLECSANLGGNEVVYSYDYNPFTQPQPWAGAGFLNWGYNHKSNWPFTKNLLKNKTFTEQLARTFEEVATVNFAFERVEAETEKCLTRLIPNMRNYVDRYHAWYVNGKKKDVEKDMHEELAPDLEYLRQRADYFLPYMREALGITQQ